MSEVKYKLPAEIGKGTIVLFRGEQRTVLRRSARRDPDTRIKHYTFKLDSGDKLQLRERARIGVVDS